MFHENLSSENFQFYNNMCMGDLTNMYLTGKSIFISVKSRVNMLQLYVTLSMS